MSFTRGATLTTAATFGHADTSNLGPTAGNGFYRRWPDDLALLQELGITDIRLTFDWARLQPKPGNFDGDWSDRFEQMIAASDAIGLRVWATLHDGAEPRWVTNEGGIYDETVSEKWWPRFAERVADRFGDSIAGWIPFTAIDSQFSASAWRNTWTTLGGGPVQVVAALDAERLDSVSDYLGSSDIIGIAMECAEDTDSAPDDERLDQIRVRLHDTIGAAAEAAADQQLIVSEFTPNHHDADISGQLVASFVNAATGAIDDGIDLGVVFLNPAISGPDSPNGLLSAERAPQPTSEAFLPAAI
jgi:beta-glucosidase